MQVCSDTHIYKKSNFNMYKEFSRLCNEHHENLSTFYNLEVIYVKLIVLLLCFCDYSSFLSYLHYSDDITICLENRTSLVDQPLSKRLLFLRIFLMQSRKDMQLTGINSVVRLDLQVGYFLIFKLLFRKSDRQRS